MTCASLLPQVSPGKPHVTAALAPDIPVSLTSLFLPLSHSVRALGLGFEALNPEIQARQIQLHVKCTF